MTSTEATVPALICIDYNAKTLAIDGVEFPYQISAEGPSVGIERGIGLVTVTILTYDITIVGTKDNA